MKKTKAVIVFVKFPELGKVKTRLASSTSKNFAVELYKIVADNIFEEISKLNSGVDVFIFFSEVDDKTKVLKWVNKNFEFLEQRGSNLGEKISDAFEAVFLRGYSKSIIIGTDIPEMKAEILDDAFSVLENNDVVISPSNDGGYSLLGIKENYSFLFNNIEWSTNSVFYNTYLKMVKNNLSFKKLSTLNDIDTKEDLIQWVNSTQNNFLKNKIGVLAKKEGIVL